MGKRIKKENANILIGILLLLVLRLIIVKLTNIQGGAYVYSVLDFIAIFILFVPYALGNIVSKLVSAKVKNGQGSNARRVLYGAFLIAIVYSIIVVLILLLAKKGICKEILLGNPSETIFSYLVILIPVIGILSVIKGYFRGIKATGINKMLNILEKIVLIICVIVTTNNYINKGAKVAKVLYTKEYEFAYGAIGVCLGLVIGYFIITIFSIIVFNLNQDKLRRNDGAGRTDDIYDVFTWISGALYKNSGFLTLFFISQIICQSMYFGTFDNKLSKSVLSYNWGSYSSVAQSVIFIAAVYFYIESFNQKKSVKIAIKNTNVAELRLKINDMFGNVFSFAIPLSLYVLVCASPIVRGLFGIDSVLAINYLRAGSFLILTLGFALNTANILNGLTKQTRVLVNSLASFAICLVSSIIFISVMHLGVYGIIISLYIYTIIFSVTNYFSIKNALKFTPTLTQKFIPVVIISAIVSFVSLLLVLLLGLFLNNLIIFIVTTIIFVLAAFIVFVKMNVVNTYTLSNALIGPLFLRIGRIFKIL